MLSKPECERSLRVISRFARRRKYLGQYRIKLCGSYTGVFVKLHKINEAGLTPFRGLCRATINRKQTLYKSPQLAERQRLRSLRGAVLVCYGGFCYGGRTEEYKS